MASSVKITRKTYSMSSCDTNASDTWKLAGSTAFVDQKLCILVENFSASHFDSKANAWPISEPFFVRIPSTLNDNCHSLFVRLITIIRRGNAGDTLCVTSPDKLAVTLNFRRRRYRPLYGVSGQTPLEKMLLTNNSTEAYVLGLVS